MAKDKIAVISTGGKQYLVSAGDIVIVEKINQKPKSKISFASELEKKETL